ncbi:TIGR01212 family radical SAM protein [Desulforhopalus singaporensis]|nr:TIGR01212 family radical SAM protein [Desulforhopalus singaporensis]
MSLKLDIFEYRDYLQKSYGEILYRVPIDAGLGCPHRRSDNKGGCTFCPEDGARAVQLGDAEQIEEQIEKGVRFAQRRYGATAFMAYLQAFTNTFSSVEQLEELVKKICSKHNFRAIAFGTRPDCLPDEVVDFLRTLNNRLDVWIELGVQSCHDKTLKRINRGHGWKESCEAIIKLHRADISVAAHLIIGLPGEGLEEYLQTVKKVAALPIDAIKLHNLHILEGTKLADEYRTSRFEVLSEHEYAEILLQLLPQIPEQIPIIRLTTDSPPSGLLAPQWSMSKGQFRKYLATQMRARTVAQGCALRDNSAASVRPPSTVQDRAVVTEDSSVTFYNKRVKEHYHTLAGARSEAENKFCTPSGLEEKLKRDQTVRILDICFGLGYNSLVSCELAIENSAALEITALELDRQVVERAAREIRMKNNLFDWNNCLDILCRDGRWQHRGCSIELLWGDARYTATRAGANFDYIWLDGFSTQKNSELWSVDFFRTLYPLLKSDGLLLTYCAAIPVRSGLMQAGFHVGETEPFGRERSGTIASPNQSLITRELPERDLHLINSVKGIPYRDPSGTRTNKEILRAREYEILRAKGAGAGKQ